MVVNGERNSLTSCKELKKSFELAKKTESLIWTFCILLIYYFWFELVIFKNMISGLMTEIE